MAASLRNFRLISRTVLQAAKTQNKTTCCRSFSRFSRQQKNASAFKTSAGVLAAAGASRAILSFNAKDPVDTLKKVDTMMNNAIEDWKDDKEMISTSRQAFFEAYFVYDWLFLEKKIDENQLKAGQARIWNVLADMHLQTEKFDMAEEYYKKSLILLQQSGQSLTDAEGLLAFRGLSIVYKKTKREEDAKKAEAFFTEQLDKLSTASKETVLQRGACQLRSS